MVRLESALQECLKQLGLRQRLQELRAVLLWPEAVGQVVSRHTLAETVERGILFVRVDSSSWAQQLSFLKQNLLARLNQDIGEPVILDIRFRTGSLLPTRAGHRPRRTRLVSTGLPPEEWLDIEEKASVVTDDNLRAILKRVMAASRTFHRWKLSRGWSPCPGCGVLHHRRGRLCPICSPSSSQQQPARGKG